MIVHVPEAISVGKLLDSNDETRKELGLLRFKKMVMRVLQDRIDLYIDILNKKNTNRYADSKTFLEIKEIENKIEILREAKKDLFFNPSK